MPKKLVISGSREYGDLEAVRRYILGLPLDTVIIQGGARGVDTVAADTAVERGMQVITLWPNWDKFGKKAGVLRNRDMAILADEITMFWDGVSPGTKTMIAFAQEYGKPYNVFVVQRGG